MVLMDCSIVPNPLAGSVPLTVQIVIAAFLNETLASVEETAVVALYPVTPCDSWRCWGLNRLL